MAIAACLFVFGIILWVIGDKKRKRFRGELVLGEEAIVAKSEEDKGALHITDPLVLLQQENPDLPAVPSSTAVYEVWEVWFQEAMRRVALRSTRRTREETLRLNDQLLRYQLQCLTYLQNKANIREIGELADLQLEAKKQALLFQIAQSKADIKALDNPKPRRYLDV
jgi:hypothetical protein